MAKLASARHTRVSPHTQPGGGNPVVSARPNKNFTDLWTWAVRQALATAPSAPLEIHSLSGDRDDWGNASEAIRGLPFARRFVRHVLRRAYMNGVMPRAASHLYSRRGRQTDEFKIVYAILSGETDSEMVRILLGSPHRAYFEACAVRALAFVYERVTSELATVKDPDVKAG